MRRSPVFVQQYLPKYGRPHVDRIGESAGRYRDRPAEARSNARSAVGTYTDIYSLLRLLFSRVGKPFVEIFGYILRFNHPQGRCTRCDGLGRFVSWTCISWLILINALNDEDDPFVTFPAWPMAMDTLCLRRPFRSG